MATDQLFTATSEAHFRYGAFISYSHSGDADFVRFLQRELERFAKPWNKMRSVRMFRDESNLSATPGLWSTLEDALSSSQWLILVASTESASSEWVNKEVMWWREHRSMSRLLILLTSGDIVWDDATKDFDRTATTAVPPALLGVLTEEPLWVDARWARTAEAYEPNDPRAQRTVVDIASTLRGIDKDSMVGEAAREYRRTKRLTRGAIVGLSGLLVLALVSAGFAWVQRNTAVAATRAAQSRQLASLADQYMDSDVGLASYFALAGYAIDENAQTQSVLTGAALASPQMVATAQIAEQVNVFADCLAPGLVVAGLRNGDVISWDWNSGEVTTIGHLTGSIQAVALDEAADVFAATDGTTVIVGEPGDAKEVDTPVSTEDRIEGIALSLDGTTLFVTGGKYDANPIWAINLASGHSSLVTAPDWATSGLTSGVQLITGTDGNITLFDRKYGSFARVDPVAGEVLSEGVVPFGTYQGPAVSPDGAWLGAFTKLSDLVWVWPSSAEISDKSEVQNINTGVDTDAYAFAIDQNGRIAISNTNGVIVTSAGSQDDQVVLVGTGATDYLEFSSDGALISAAGNRLMAWDVSQSSRVSVLYPVMLGSNCTACGGPTIAISPDGTQVVSIDGNETFATVLSLVDGSATDLADGDASSRLNSFDYDFPVWVGNSLIMVVFPQTGSNFQEGTLPEQPDGVVALPIKSPPRAVGATDSGDLLVVSSLPKKTTNDPSGTVLTWYSISGDAIRTETLWSGMDPPKVILGPGAQYIVAIIGGTQIEVLDTASLQVKWETTSPQNYSYQIVASQDVLVIERTDGKVDVYGSSGALERTIPLDACHLADATSDGNLIALACPDQSVMLVDLSTGQHVAKLPGVSTAPYAKIGVQFAQDGDHIAVAQYPASFSSSDNGYITYYDLSNDRLKEAACTVASTWLSVDEWASYAPGIERPDIDC